MEQKKQYIFSEELVNNLLNYLGSQPLLNVRKIFAQVEAELVSQIQPAPEKVNEKKEEATKA